MANQFNAPLLQYFDSAGNPLSGGLLYIYNTGTTTLTPIYSDILLSVPLTNPVVLNTSGFTSSDGATPCSIYWASGTAVKMKLTSSTASSIFTIDPVPGIDSTDLASYFTAAGALLTLNVADTLNIAAGGTNFKLDGVAISTSLPDTNGIAILKFTTTLNAVNQITITDSVTGTAPTISSSGTDTNVGLTLAPKGAATVNLGTASTTGVKLIADQAILDSSGNPYVQFSKTASAVNSLKITNTATGTRPILGVAGDATRGMDIKDSNSNTLLSLPSTASAVDYLTVGNIGTGNPAIIPITATGTDTNIGINLISKGTGTVNINGLPPVTSVVTQVFTSSGTYTPTSGMIFCDIEVSGGGGGGGGSAAVSSATAAAAAGGGGGGGYGRKLFTASAIGASQVITIGAAGAGGVAGANNGTAGGTSSVGALVVANGGSGGGGAASVTGTGPEGGGGAGGTASSGTVNTNGQTGTVGMVFGSVGSGMSGSGGENIYGRAGLTSASNTGTSTAGMNATGYGAGGGGAASGNTNVAQVGGNGTPGLVIITEYIGG